MVSKGKVVSLCYRLTNDSGEEIERTEKSEPFSYLHGSKNIIAGLEKGLEGLKVGDKKKITVSPAQGYGEFNQELLTVFERSQFPEDAAVEVGDQFQVRDNKGGATVFEVKKIDGNKIHVDGNHPLAGQTLCFDVEIVELRDATQEEKDHGHIHSGDGHGHDH